jgi:hypothetical protein
VGQAGYRKSETILIPGNYLPGIFFEQLNVPGTSNKRNHEMIKEIIIKFFLLAPVKVPGTSQKNEKTLRKHNDFCYNQNTILYFQRAEERTVR